MKGTVQKNCRGCLELYEIECLAYLGRGTVVETNGIYGSLGIVLQESEVISVLKLWEEGLKLWLFTLRLEICV